MFHKMSIEGKKTHKKSCFDCKGRFSKINVNKI
jgi:hypothetical protein